MLQIADLFRVLPYFKNLDTATIQAVTRAAIHRTYEANQIILLEGEPAGGLYIVQDGWLKVSKVSLAGRVLHLITLVEDLSLRKVEARLARLLLEEAQGDVV